MTSDEVDEMAEYERRRAASKKTLAIVGLVLVGGLLFWKCAHQAGTFGLGVGSPAASTPDLEISVQRDGQLRTRGCSRSDIEDCVAIAKTRFRNDEGSSKVLIHAEPGAPVALVREVQALVTSFELTPILD